MTSGRGCGLAGSAKNAGTSLTFGRRESCVSSARMVIESPRAKPDRYLDSGSPSASFPCCLIRKIAAAVNASDS